MNEIILLKLGEVVLKGLNRRSFEDKLTSNVRRRLTHYGSFRVYSKQSTIYVEPQEEDCDLDGAYAACRQVFGIVAATRARSCPKDKDAIFHCARNYLGAQLQAARTFKVETKRADKKFPMNSMEISQYVGGLLHDEYPHLKVDVHAPELCVHVEVREKAAYVHGPSESGAGGLPIGMGGTAVSLLSGGIDSPAASYMIAKRGVKLELVHFFSPPYTSQQALDKVKQLARELTPWCGRMKLHIVPHHAPVHDASGPGRGGPDRGESPGHRRESGAGGQPDHGRAGCLRRGVLPPRAPAGHRHGQDGDHRHCTEIRHL